MSLVVYLLPIPTACLEKPYNLSRRNAIVDSIAYGLQSTAAMFTIALGLYAGQRLMESAQMELWRLIVVVLGMTITMISIASSARLATAFATGRFAAREVRLAFGRTPRALAVSLDYS